MIKKLQNFSKALNIRNGYKNLPAMIFMTDLSRCSNPEEVIAKLSRDTIVIIRDYDIKDRDKFVSRISSCCQKRRIKFSIAGKKVFLSTKFAWGIHIPESMMENIPGLKRKYPNHKFTVSCHSRRAAVFANQKGADAVLFSPVFPTQSHPGKRAEGVISLARFAYSIGLPVYALGGIDSLNVKKLSKTKLAGIAGISLFI